MNTKTKLIDCYRAYCEREGIELTQDEVNRLCQVPLKFLNRACRTHTANKRHPDQLQNTAVA